MLCDETNFGRSLAYFLDGLPFSLVVDEHSRSPGAVRFVRPFGFNANALAAFVILPKAA
ncbi:hypothetical protein C8R46DRAFT_1237826 [Mycena filopes]|nr:hypothetical protein C8R46DRAFT_1237826 [Mycena filopes]